MRASSEELITFVSVVENGSFSRAAEKLGQDNSVVSRAVKRLEKKLGITLLNRTTRQISLTHEGERYFIRVQKTLQELAAAEDDILENRADPQGLLRIDAATPVILHIISPLIAEFSRRYPKISLMLFSSESNINLIEHKVDVAIRIGELEDSSLRARELMLSYRSILASPDYLQKWGQPGCPDDLAEHRCLGFNKVVDLNIWPLLCADGKPLTVQPFISSESGETLRSLCLQGNGIACLSDFMSEEDVAQGRLVKLFEADILQIAMPMHAVYYSDQTVSLRIRCFIDFLAEKMANRETVA